AWGAAESAAAMSVETAVLPHSSKSAMHAETTALPRSSALEGKALAEEAGIGDDGRARTARDACCRQRFWMKAGFGEAC
ncbi:hypothetical protein THAOC_21452, partial [Thalassiosira oceanica]